MTNAAGGLLASGFGRLKGSIFGGQAQEKEAAETSPEKLKKEDPKASKPGTPLTLRISKTLAQNIIFNTMSQFLPYFVSFQMKFEQSRDLLFYFCKKYELDQGRTHLLLSELESISRN